MIRRPTIESPIAHLIGPGQIRMINRRLTYITPTRHDLRLDVNHLRAVYCYGGISFSDEALRQLMQHDVDVSLLSRHGTRCYGRLVGCKSSSTRLRMLQHRWFGDQEFSLQLARSWVADKIDSQREAARHLQRHGKGDARALIRNLDDLQKRVQEADCRQSLRGLEGVATAAWFALWASQLRRPWTFPARSRRPPKDPVNALLSLGYTWLTNRTGSRASAEGFELNLGTLHEYRPGRPSLACDLVEPLRVPAVDRWVAALLNRRSLSPEDFEPREGGVYLVRQAFTKTLAAFEEHWASSGMTEQLERLVIGLARRLREHDATCEAPTT